MSQRPVQGPFGGLARVFARILVLAVLAPVPVHAQAPKPAAAAVATYEVLRGDTLFRIAGRTRPQGVTVFQMIVALYRANRDAFLDDNINQLEVGRLLTIPSGEAVTVLDAAQAAAEYRALIAKPQISKPQLQASPPPPPVPQEPGPAPKPRVAPPQAALTPSQAAERYEQGRQAERSGDLRAAMAAYLSAAESGNGLAQKRLGEIYDAGNAVVTRDYETALKWYQKAREQGIKFPKPVTRAPIPPK